MRIEENDHLTLALREAARRSADRPSLRDLQETLGQMVAVAVATIDPVVAGSVTLYTHGRITTRHATSEGIRKLDETQAELREGPCVTAYEDPPASGIVVVQDVDGADGEQWPRFAPLVVEAGYRGLVSITLSADGAVRGALNLYAADPDAFTEHCLTLAGLFGLHAGLLLFGTEQPEDPPEATDGRDLIGKATGVLMERFTVDDEAAFRMLVKTSQATDVTLLDVARWVTDERSDEVRSTAP